MKRKNIEELIQVTKRFKSDQNHKISTKLIHSGQEPDKYTGAVMIPITLSSTFAQKGVGVKYEGGFEYSRSGNPTRNALEECIASVEGGEDGFAFSSGLGATTAITHLLKTGDEVICFDDVYGGTGRFFRLEQEKMGIKVHFVDLNKKGALEEKINEKTKMVWIETPSNPTLKIVDIEETAKICKKHKLTLVVDNTFMSPVFQQPLKLGADIVVYSATKYMNGHSDVVMGMAITSNKEISEQLRYLQNSLGITPSPFDCFMVLRGLKTLQIRMERHEKNAKVIAEYLEKHEKVLKVTYPGLKSHPQHELAKKQMKGFGGMITVYLKGGLEESNQFLSNLKIFTLAESLGGVESLAEHPALMTHMSVPEKLRNELGIKDNMVRLSCGIEDVEDLLEDIKNGLDSIKTKSE